MSESFRNPSRCIIVLGVHRSGTSALAGVLTMLGADAGSKLMPARDDNPKGFWEHADIVAAHDRLLEHLDSSWDDELPLAHGWWRREGVSSYRDELRDILLRDFSRSALWILKDPRICRLLPLWLDMLRELRVQPNFVISLRDPGEVARSLERRDGIPDAKAQLLWLEHLLEAERRTRDHPRVTIAYDDLLADWRAAARRVSQVLSLPLRLDDAKVSAQIDGFLEPSLHHHRAAGQQQSGHPITALAREAYQRARAVPAERLGDALAFARDRVEEIGALVAPWAIRMRMLDRRAKDLERRVEELEARLGHTERYVERVRTSLSWRVTRPFRVIARWLSFAE